ncbi:MAG: ABC transporter substrate-binding protein, partial [Pseudomonadota bacterium]
MGVGTADGAQLSFDRAVLGGAGFEEGTDFEFLPVGDGGPTTAAFTRGGISACAASTADGAITGQHGLMMRDLTPPSEMSLFGNGLAAMRSRTTGRPCGRTR